MDREHLVPVAPGVDLWVTERGDPGAPVVLLVMGAASSGLLWPEDLVDDLARDHRARGSSYALRDLATDAVAVVDALEVDRAHVVGMSLGGLLAQLLLLDHPDRLRSATLFCTGPLGGAAGEPAPGPSAELLAFWATMAEPRDDDAELAWRVEHWRLLNGTGTPFDPAEWADTERRVAAHSGGLLSATAGHGARHGPRAGRHGAAGPGGRAPPAPGPAHLGAARGLTLRRGAAAGSGAPRASRSPGSADARPG